MIVVNLGGQNTATSAKSLKIVPCTLVMRDT